MWISTTGPSVFIQTNQAWFVPIVQSTHILGIAMVVGSITMMALRLLGWAGMDQTVRQTHARYSPWLFGSICLLAVTGVLMIIGEPVRELVSFSFWAKMALIVIGIVVALIFERSLKKNEQHWEDTLVHHGGVKALAVLTLLVWTGVIVMGRLIAYDHLWGALSPAARY